MDLPLALVCIAMIGFVAFYQWLRLQRRALLSRERVAAIEKGAALPEPERGSAWDVERILLLAGLCWLSIGLAFVSSLSALLAYASPGTEEIPHGIQWAGLAPIGIGLSHIVVYLIGRSRDRR